MKKTKKRNEVLYKAIMEIWPSVNQFCQQFHFNASQIGKLINLQMCPLGNNSDYRSVCRRLSAVLGIGLEELFPLQLYGEEPPIEFQNCTHDELAAMGLMLQDPLVFNLSLLKKVEWLSKAEKLELVRQLKEKQIQTKK